MSVTDVYVDSASTTSTVAIYPSQLHPTPPPLVSVAGSGGGAPSVKPKKKSRKNDDLLALLDLM